MQDRKKRVREIEATLQEFAEVDSWQAEVSHLDKCIAWADPIALRAEIERHTAMVEETVPAQIEQVRLRLLLLSVLITC